MLDNPQVGEGVESCRESLNGSAMEAENASSVVQL